MQPLTPKPAYSILCCPVCRLDLTPSHRSLACRNGHSFDIARTGYVNLLSGRKRLPSEGGDDRQRLLRRASFLGRGHFNFISAAIIRHLVTKTHPVCGSEFYVVDAGCGTAHHLAETSERLFLAARVNHHCLGIDLSKKAIRFASQRLKNSGFIIADLWQDWPVRTAGVDLLMSVFAPKNFVEMTRVLRPGGLLALAYPGPSHLVELRHEFSMLKISPEKSRRYLEAAQEEFAHTSIERHRARSVLSRDEILDLILMGPSAGKVTDKILATNTSIMEVTFDVEILFAHFPRAVSSSRARR
jgi:23S rRNA (guanine745-N1)-methyltransferase